MASPRRLLDITDHRPWPLPVRPWIMFQSWRELLFAHWSVPHDTLRTLVPAQLELDLFDGRTWVGLTPFRIVGLRPRFLPPLPRISTFPELNLRTYVRIGDRPGIYFFTLDAARLSAVVTARLIYRLPYHHAEMEVEHRDGWIHYSSRRLTGDAAFAGRYRPAGRGFEPEAGTIEHFLTERYALYTVDDRGRIRRGDIHHPPWTVQPAQADIRLNTIPAAHGLRGVAAPPLLHYAAQQDTLIWLPARVD